MLFKVTKPNGRIDYYKFKNIKDAWDVLAWIALKIERA